MTLSNVNPIILPFGATPSHVSPHLGTFRLGRWIWGPRITAQGIFAKNPNVEVDVYACGQNYYRSKCATPYVAHIFLYFVVLLDRFSDVGSF